MAKKFMTTEEIQVKRIMNVLKKFPVDYWVELREHEENLLHIIKAQIMGLPRRQKLNDDLILRSVDLFIQLFEYESSVSSKGNEADDDTDDNSSVEKTKSFNAPGWERLPQSPLSPRVVRDRRALPAPTPGQESLSTLYPETDATCRSEQSSCSIGSPLAESTVVIYLTPIANLYGDQQVPLSLEEEMEFDRIAEVQVENGSQELANNNAYVQLMEE